MEIPSGTVTFLFTEIEESARLAQEFPESYQSELQKHDSILAECIECNNGFVFKNVSGAFCVSFNNAVDAIKAAVEIQEKLFSEEPNEVE